MTTDHANADSEEITVSMPAGMVDRVDELCVRRGYGARSQVVAEAIQQAADGNG